MLFIKYMMLVACFGLLATALGAVVYDIYLAFELDRMLRRRTPDAAPVEPPPTVSPVLSTIPRRRREIRWDLACKLAGVAAFLGLAGSSILVVPDGVAAVRISQLTGVRPGTLYPGTHFIVPLIERVAFYDIRDRVFSTAATEIRGEKLEVLIVQAHEGLPVGMAVSVRYRIDSKRLDYVQANLPQPIEQEVIAPVVVAALSHQLAPNYVVRDVFSTKREEFRTRAAQAITTAWLATRL